MEFSEDSLIETLKTGFISRKIVSDNTFAPSLLVNDRQKKKDILSSLTEELKTCQAFDFSIAFITEDGLASILETLDEICKKGVRGRILTTNYLNFTTPGAISKLMEFQNIELRVYTQGGFHPKGYVFKNPDYYSMIIGSANLTDVALTENQEWSIKFISCLDGQIVYSVCEEFERIWSKAQIVDDKWLKEYKEIYKKTQHFQKNEQVELLAENEDRIPEEKNELQNDMDIVPNSMQKEAMTQLASLRSQNKKRALLIAATGTGKTYLSILDVKQFNAKRVLYVAHRDMILNKACESFKSAIPEIKTGFLNGQQKDTDVDFIFASVFTLAKDETLHLFDPDSFDYIIVDEVHHAGATSYKKVIDYFKPEFLLGLTATPERTDGFDIFEMFNYNIAYEIRLQKALENKLLCPFHYYGISDLTVGGEVVDDKSEFSKLIDKERIQHIERAIRLYKSNDFPVKGLIFCSRTEEAHALSKALNKDGFHTIALTGSDSDIEREETIERLESDEDPLEYIISVDIFNEGVDIPCLNQIVMLRPTQSAIIFVQQLGRGLRLYNNKKYVSVIDFIGNYENNFFIPIALFGDNSYNKDSLRRSIAESSISLPGGSTVQMDEIARKKIFESINKASFKNLALLKSEYTKLKERLGKIPSMIDFVKNGFADPFLFIDYAGSYYIFKQKIEGSTPSLSAKSICSLQFISLEFSRGIRLHEPLILNLLASKESISVMDFKDMLEKEGILYKEEDIYSMLNTLSPAFYTESARKKYGETTYIRLSENKERIERTEEYSALLEDTAYKKELLDTLDYAIHRAHLKEGDIIISNNLVLYRKYTRKDVCKLLNWESDCSSTIYGYKTESKGKNPVCPIFVTYKKSDDISETTKYDDSFIDHAHFNWMSRSHRTSSSEEVAEIIRQKENNMNVLLFVKKNDDEGSDFYCMGQMNYLEFKDTSMPTESGDVPVVNIKFEMKSPVPEKLYNYLVG